MSKKEFQRINIINKVINKTLKQTEASKLMHLSYRQTNRIINKVKRHGLSFIVHANRGKSSPKKFTVSFKKNIASIYKHFYPDFGPTFASEKLLEKHNISINKESLRKILIEHNLWASKKLKLKQCHVWRERKHHCGELIQIDASHHHWLENRLNQEFCLFAAIDDASNSVFAHFYEYEGTFPILDFSMRFVKTFGIPYAMYLDKHSTYKTTREPSVDEQLRNIQPETQFQRVMRSIGSQIIFAHSPQAKGRVERLFKTLQDRLIKELRLANICSIQDANIFLKSFLCSFNLKFSIPSKETSSFFTPVNKNFDYKWTFSIQDKRIIQRNYTIRWLNRLFLLNNPSISLKRRQVIIQQALDGTLRFSTKHKYLRTSEITQEQLNIAKENKKFIKKLTAAYSYKKSKKSWMDNFYLSNSRNFYS